VRRRAVLAALASAAVAEPIAAVGQQPARPPRVGLLMGSSPSVEAATLDAFRQALTEAGYSDGQTIILEVRYAEGQTDLFGSLARELVALAPSVIACVGSKETAALQAATRTIPIVFIQAPNPVELGLAPRWRGRVATLRDLRRCRPSSMRNDWNNSTRSCRR
jgi:putative tryptophan/tyrosine transport system substrate-binding protein